MSNLIQIKRSLNTATPSSLANGELAFTANGDALFIGSNGAVVAVGGKRTPGTLTANQALVANATSYLDAIKVANATIDKIYANGAHGTAGQVLSSNSTGGLFFSTPAPSVTGSNTQLQFNDEGAANGTVGVTFDKNSNTLNISNVVSVGANVSLSTSTLSIGNSTVNSTTNSSSIVVGSATFATLGANSITSNSVSVGSNVNISTSALSIGNSTVNSSINSISLSVNQANITNAVLTFVHANGAFGTNGQVLTSNSTGGVHFAAPVTNLDGLSDVSVSSAAAGEVLISNSTGFFRNVALSGDITVDSSGTVTISADSVALGTDTTGNYVATITAGNGLSGNATTEGSAPTIAVVAGSGIASNATGVHVVANSGLASNATGVHVVANDGITSNASGIFVTDGDGLTVNSTGVHVGAGNGLSVNSIAVAVVANSGIASNSTGVFVVANSGLASNATGVFVVANSGIASNSSGVFVVAGSGVASNSTGVFVVAGAGIASNATGVHVVANSGIASNSSGVFVVANDGITSNASGIFVTDGDGLTVNSTGVHVGAGNGLSVSASDIAVVAGNGIASNSTGVFVVAGAGIASNATGVHVIAGTGVTSNATGVHIGQAVGTTDNVTFNDLIVNGNTTIGSNTTDVVTVNARLSSNIVPSANITYSLGTNELRFFEVHAQNTHSEFLYVDKDVSISGNLTVSGSLVTINVSTLAVTDSLIQLAANNTTTDTLDIGFFGNYNIGGGAHEHAGLFRDASTDTFKLFKGLQDAPTTVVDTSGTGYTVATLEAFVSSGGLVSNSTAVTLTANSTVAVSITANTLSLSTALPGGSGGTGLASFTTEDILVANSSNGFRKLAVSANGYVLQVVGGAVAYGTLDGGSF